MNSDIEELLCISTSGLSAFVVDISVPSYVSSECAYQLAKLLERTNGFYAFEHALHVMPSRSAGKGYGLDKWNSRELWIDFYNGLADECFFFAEDVFGGQFCLRAGGVFSFEPETGSLEFISKDLHGWAKEILNNFDILTGHALARSWQMANGPLDPGCRLIPKQPFVLGGAFSVDNLASIEAVGGMRTRANLATQLRDLPDGASVRWKLIE